jgi:hypothetical protein
MNAKLRYGPAAVALSAVLLAGRGGALEVTIDSFTEATDTAVIPAAQILANMQGQSVTATDSGLSTSGPNTVVGGVRKMTVTATLIGPGAQRVVSGIDTSVPDLCFNFTDNADGFDELLYDRGGLGLQNLNLSHALGIQLEVVGSGSASTPYYARRRRGQLRVFAAVQHGCLPFSRSLPDATVPFH